MLCYREAGDYSSTTGRDCARTLGGATAVPRHWWSGTGHCVDEEGWSDPSRKVSDAGDDDDDMMMMMLVTGLVVTALVTSTKLSYVEPG